MRGQQAVFSGEWIVDSGKRLSMTFDGRQWMKTEEFRHRMALIIFSYQTPGAMSDLLGTLKHPKLHQPT